MWDVGHCRLGGVGRRNVGGKCRVVGMMDGLEPQLEPRVVGVS
jgi:hypothetical protein